MKLLYVAPVAKRFRAIEDETRRAADDGHEVHLVAAYRDHWDDHPLDPRVTAHWLHPRSRATESALVTLLAHRLPRGLLGRLRRGPLARPASAALHAWNRRVAAPIERRRKRRTAERRFEHRSSVISALIEQHRYDWLVLSEPGALDALAERLPGLLERRPELRTTYTYEAFTEAQRAD